MGPGLVTDIPASERSSREVLYYAAKIAAFADDLYDAAPPLPNPDTPQGKDQLKFSMLTCTARARDYY